LLVLLINFFFCFTVGAKNAKRNKAVKSDPIRISEKNLGIFSIHSSKHPDMQKFKSRRRSFLAQNWPKQKENLIPHLCQAGFYYTGTDISTRFQQN
jgi:hypothetical protein